MTNFHGDEAKKNSKWLTQKNVIFQNRQFSIFFCENFMDQSLDTVRAPLQGLPLGFDIMFLALVDRNMQVRFGLKVIWES